MKTFARSIPFKISIFLLTAILLFISVVGGIFTVTLEIYQFYDYSKDELKEELLSRRIADECYTVFRGEYYHHAVATDPNFRYTVLDKDGATLAGTETKNTAYTRTYYYYEWKEEGYNSLGEYYSYYDSAFVEEENFKERTPLYTVTGGYDAFNPVTNGDLYWMERGIDVLFGFRWILPLVTGAALLLTAFGTVFLCCVAGRTPRSEEAVLTGWNKLPLDLFLLVAGGLGVGVFFLGWFVLESERISFYLLSLPILGLIASALLLASITSLSARIKVGGMLKTSLIGRLGIWSFCGLRRGCNTLRQLIRKIPTVPTVASVAGLFAACNILLGILSKEPLVFLLLTLESVIGFFFAVVVAVGFASVERHGDSIANGDLDHKMDTVFLVGPLKKYGETLNRIGDGLNTAVNERIKSERMKTELITNVSHDIKTPLTSIINYVDLLSKKEAGDEDSAEYLLILKRQSARLKKLAEDIVEASKASSGALVIDPVPCDLGVLLEQTAGEYEEKMKDCGLTVLLEKPEEEVTVLADGKRLWRVFDNLMNNICKYALSGTRVYLTVTQEEERATICFRNVSKDPLNIRPEELTERFVRGDASRHSEGSGLGLAIAQSLTELQGGTFEISIDADLFKVTITFPILK
ncbi:MAG: sensor histidine kinase [Clostridia bacterium]|nr:sensor histidine kinase [Clostridia bacterium]